MNTLEQQAIFAIAATVVFSFLYFLLLDRIKGYGKNAKKRLLTTKYILRKGGGFLLLGLIPGVLFWLLSGFGPVRAGLQWGDTGEILPWVLWASVFFILLNVINSRNPGIRAMYPELRVKDWGHGGLLTMAGGWLVYLTGYEYLFRGILLFTCYEAFGLWPAVVINLALYSALHLPKGMKEAVAAIPFGALLCYLTLESHSILAAIFIHAVQAISCELLCIWRNPGMSFQFNKTALL